jgi:hypothetical protein
MAGPSPGSNGEESSSSSVKPNLGHPSVEDFDGDDRADLSFDSALLADDPLDEEATNAP